ncbi:hypothetical protein Uis1B_0630 [Bifidobacterium margollesii]|uniref:Uncharacterized protein n=1 Tax=Bifidobacterium margollesii TaxID=2020964 RepID=A0A2N5JBB6_9BIFI|nr:hypothetical protein Uis1B_0630 [Bifidobacterium margollesii]
MFGKYGRTFAPRQRAWRRTGASVISVPLSRIDSSRPAAHSAPTRRSLTPSKREASCHVSKVRFVLIAIPLCACGTIPNSEWFRIHRAAGYLDLHSLINHHRVALHLSRLISSTRLDIADGPSHKSPFCDLRPSRPKILGLRIAEILRLRYHSSSNIRGLEAFLHQMRPSTTNACLKRFFPDLISSAYGNDSTDRIDQHHRSTGTIIRLDGTAAKQNGLLLHEKAIAIFGTAMRYRPALQPISRSADQPTHTPPISCGSRSSSGLRRSSRCRAGGTRADRRR